jgi:hypothetical protein
MPTNRIFPIREPTDKLREVRNEKTSGISDLQGRENIRAER